MDTNSIVVPADHVKFGDLCKLLEDLYNLNISTKKSRREEQDKVLCDYINNFKLNAANASGVKDCTIFPILRLLLPYLERERGAYNLKESKLGQLLVKTLSLHKNSQNAQKLLNFRSIGNSKHGSDFPSVAYFVLKSRVSGSDTLTVKDINNSLDKISNAEVGNKACILDEVFSYIILNTTPIQQKWYFRIILKDLKLGMGITRILSALHPDAPEYYESCSSLLKVCEELDESKMRPADLGIQLFTAISPMLSERLNVMHIGKLHEQKTYLIETKFDGERFQMHVSNGNFEYFSRKGFSYSDKYGKTYDSEGLLTPHLKDCFIANADSFILDGEMMGWHKERQCFGSKGMSFDIKKITEHSKYTPCFCVYDILYYNGLSLIGAEDKGGIILFERLKILDTLFTDKPGVIYHSKRNIVQNRSEIVDALNDANAKGEEGIVVKDIHSYYLANKRNAGWYKVKPEYTEGAMEDLDLVIVGGDYAENKKRGMVKTFMVALADKLAPGQNPHRWLAVSRVATGLSLDEREQLCTILEPHWKLCDKVFPPDCLVWNKERPELWVHPEKSVVLQVRATELIRSKSFATEYTLRFPRVIKIRPDKPVNDVLTLDEFNSLVKEKAAVIKLTTGQVNSDDVDAMTENLRIRRKRPAAKIEVADHFKAFPVSSADKEVTSKALEGRKICVLSDDEDCKKVDLEHLIHSHGGIVVQNTSYDTWCCIAGRRNVRVRNALETLTCDIVDTQWLRNLPSMPEPCSLPPPLHMLAVTRKTQVSLARHYDRFGDSYTEFVDKDILKKCFDKMDRDKEIIYLATKEMMDIDKELFDDHSPFGYLRGCFLYVGDPGDRLAIKARYYGAMLCDLASSNLTHVIVEDKDVADVLREDITIKEAYFVTKLWLESCYSANKRVLETEFLIYV